MTQALFPIICIIGPTASGKTKLAVQLASELNAEIISVDSRQVYKGMDIGTGKDLIEYEFNEVKIRYHLIDIISPTERYHLKQFQADFWNSVNDIKKRGKRIIVCGGTGLYLESVIRNFEYTVVPVNETLRIQLEKFDKDQLLNIYQSNKTIHPKNPDLSTIKRIIRAIEIQKYSHSNSIESTQSNLNEFKVFATTLTAKDRIERIDARLEDRLKDGLIKEVQELMNSGVSADQLIYFGLEYKLCAQYILNQISYEEFVFKLKTGIHQFAKRQMTYFRKMEKAGINIYWLDGNNKIEENKKLILDELFKTSNLN